jgi:hypothetical protein
VVHSVGQIKQLRLDVCVHTALHTLNKDISLNFNKGLINIVIVILSISLYLQLLLYIQDDSVGICTTLGNDSMSDSKQKSSYEHGSDFEQLRSYGHFLIPVHALM